MSNHDSVHGRMPTKVSYAQNNLPQSELLKSNIPVNPSENELLIAGQGTIVFELPHKSISAEIVFSSDSGEEVRIYLDKSTASFTYKNKGTESWTNLELENEGKHIISPVDNYNLGIDDDKRCRYWVSIDDLNKRLRYGKGEMRLSTCLLDYQYDIPLTLFNKAEKKDHLKYIFINDLKKFKTSEGLALITLWKDPVISEPPSLVVPPADFTMEDAATGTKATPTSLSKECQILYGNVADFQLNTPDFPDFEQAIEYSMRTEGCIGYKILDYKKKNSPFNSENNSENPSEYKELYLRITLGSAQGESPGIPYVMEIWPVGCASPVHQHGFTHAIIKVLRGEVDVDLYRMLPLNDKVNVPLGTVTFKQGDVTYLMPEVNQYHLLKNNLLNKDTCITIQCYSYSQDDDTHQGDFIYMEENEEGHFDPISDYDFLEFKALVKKEWQAFLDNKFWLKD